MAPITFDCTDADLNDFLCNAAIPSSEELLSVTYVLLHEIDGSIAAFVSVLNDKIAAYQIPDGKKWKKQFRNRFPHAKQYKSYPAVKIGRFAVQGGHQGKKNGTMLVNFIKEMFISNNRTGCCYITVDAYAKSLGFYTKNGFEFLTEKDENDDTRLMYFDLRLLKNADTLAASE